VSGEPFSQAAIVLRFGTKKLADVRRSIRGEYLDSGRPGLSVACSDELTIAELARRARRPNAKMCVSTIGRIQHALPGLRVEAAPAEGFSDHALILFAEMPDDYQLERLLEAFDDPIDNPYRSLPDV
jgi:hypothetical protein